MSKKIYPNEPCPCGSGLKYKHCCSGKADDEEFNNPINFFKNYKELRKESKIKQCLHPNKNECSEKIIGAHSIQNNKILNKISKNGKVLMPCPKGDNPLALMTDYGRKEASVFTGFCQYHDKIVFQEIEDRDFAKSEKQIFLYTYRAFALEYHRRQEVVKMEQLVMKKKPSLIQMEDEDNPFFSTRLAKKDFEEDEKVFNQALLNSNYDVITSVIWEFSQSVKFACTGMEALQYDLKNNKVQDLLNVHEPAQHVYVTVFPENGKTYCIFSWLKRNDELFSEYKVQLEELDEQQRKNYINNLLPNISENIAINPDAWDGMSKEQKIAFGIKFRGMEMLGQEQGIFYDRTKAPPYDLFSL